jgi:hypothetical protein
MKYPWFVNLSRDEELWQILTFRVAVKLSKQKKDVESGHKIGYVDFENVAVTEEAFGSGSVVVNGEPKVVKFSKKNVHRERVTVSDKKLFVTGVPSHIRDEDLSKVLGKCTISGREDGKKYFFAEYNGPEEQRSALERLSDAQIDGSKIQATPAYEKAIISGIKGLRRKGEVN